MLFVLQEATLIQYPRWDDFGTKLCSTEDCCDLNAPFAAEIGICIVVEAKIVGCGGNNTLMNNAVPPWRTE